MPDSFSNDCPRAHAVRIRPTLASIRSVLLLALAFSIVLASLPCARRVGAAETRVALVDPAPNVLDAVSVALSAWGLRVISISSTHLPADLAAATAMARDLAREHDAGAVAWLASPQGASTSLWLYDAQTEQMMVRPLSQAPPFDDASAAALALTVKTLLRSTTVAPPQERLAQPAATTAPSGATTPPSTPIPAPPAASASGAPPPASTSVAAPPAGVPATPSHAWRAEAVALARLPTGTSASAAPRASLGVGWWPRWWREHLGFGLEARAGTSLDVTGARFAGSFSDTSVALTARGAVAIRPLWLEVAAGPSLEITSLTGAEIATGRTSSILRADPAFDLAFVPQLALGDRLRLGLYFGLDAFLRTQRYLLGSDLVLRVPPVSLDLGGRASLALD